MLYWFEKYYPLTLAILLTLLLYKFQQYIAELKSIIPQVAQNALTISGTLIGFLLTILSLVSTINTRRMHFIRTTAGMYERVMGYLKKAILSNIAVIVASFLITFLNREQLAEKLMKGIDRFFIFVTLLSIFLTIRFALIFMRLMTDPEPKTIG